MSAASGASRPSRLIEPSITDSRSSSWVCTVPSSSAFAGSAGSRPLMSAATPTSWSVIAAAGATCSCACVAIVDRTVAFTSCTAIRAAMPMAVCWMGSISRLNTSIVALSPASTAVERIVGEHDDEIGVAGVERSECGVLVVDETLRLDELVELIARRIEHLLVDRSLRADEHGSQADRILGETGAEQQEEHERADDEQRQEPRLPEDLGQLLADERLRTDEPPPRAVGVVAHRRGHRRRDGGRAVVGLGEFVDAHVGAPIASAVDFRWRSTTRTNASS